MLLETERVFHDGRVTTESMNSLFFPVIRLSNGQLKLLSSNLETADPAIYNILQNVCLPIPRHWMWTDKLSRKNEDRNTSLT